MTHSAAGQRSAERFRPEESALVESSIFMLRGDEFVQFPCQLTDISVGGCAIRATIPQELTSGVAVVQFRGLLDDSTLEVAGRLCWNHQTSLCTQTFGFRFRFPLEQSSIDQLIERGVITRRSETREDMNLDISLRRSHGKPGLDNVVLYDISPTGARLGIDQPLEIGERILLSPPNVSLRSSSPPVTAAVTVVWVAKKAGSLQCGCRFASLSTARSFYHAVAALPV